MQLVDQYPERVRIAHIGGAGNKSIHLACKNIDAYASAYLDFWDVCAGDVICRAQGCFSADKKGNLIDYTEKQTSKCQLGFVLITRNQHYFEYLNNLMGLHSY